MTLRFLLVSSLALATVACDAGDGDDDTAGDAGATSGDPSDGDPSPPAESSDPAPADDGATTSAEPTIPWADVICGETTCTDGQVCVLGGVDCDYGPCEDGVEAEWVSAPPRCEALPADCDPTDARSCLEIAYCEGGEFATFEEGTLACGPVALDCFCGI